MKPLGHRSNGKHSIWYFPVKSERARHNKETVVIIKEEFGSNMSLFGKKKEEAPELLDTIMRPEAIDNLAHECLYAFSRMKSTWNHFTDEEKQALLLWGQKMGGKLLSKVGMLTMSGGDTAAASILETLKSQKSKTMSRFMTVITDGLKENNG